MDDYGEYEEYEEEEATPKKRSDLILPLTGGTLVTAEIVSALMHGGPLGIGAGLLASGFVYLKGQDILDVVQGIIPLPTVADIIHLPTSQGRSRKDRLFGRYPAVDESEAEDKEIIEPLQPKPAPGASALPRRSPRFAKMQHLITPEQDILGFDGKQFIYAESLKQSVSVALIGVPHAGKTSCLTFHVAQAVCRNAIVRGWDLHGDVAADLGDFFNIMEDVDDILDDCEWLQGERDRRLALRKKARAGDQHALKQWKETRELFYIVDELNALMLRLKQRKADREMVADTLLSLIAEGRKLKMRCIIAGQTMPAAIFGESGSSARDIISTKYAFQSRDAQAQYFGIEQDAIENLLPLIVGKDSAGYAILDGGSLLHALLVSIPYTTVEDIRALLDESEDNGDKDEDEEDVEDEYRNAETAGSAGNRRGNESGNAWKQRVDASDAQSGNNVTPFPESAGNGRKHPNSPLFADGNAETQEPQSLPKGVTWSDLEHIQGAYEAGWALREIVKLVKMDGRKYDRFKAACEYLGIDPRAKAQ